MRRLLILIVWLVGTFSGLILVTFTPQSWQCPKEAVGSMALFNPEPPLILGLYHYGEDLQFWDKEGLQLQWHYSLVMHTAPETSLAFSPDGKQVLTGSANNTAKLWTPRAVKNCVP